MTRRVRVGLAADVVAGEVTRVWLGKDERGLRRQALIVRDEAGLIRAFLNLCKHLPIPLDGFRGPLLTEDRVHLVCLTHGALYRIDDGYCVEGPCEGTTLCGFETDLDSQGVLWLVDTAPDQPPGG